MTERAIKTKEYLSKVYHMTRQLQADERMLEVMGQRLFTGVANYQHDGGAHDTDAAIARHEDQLLDYSIQLQKVEKLRTRLGNTMTEIRDAIDDLSDPEWKAIAIDRYITNLRWNDIARLEHMSEAKVYRINSIVIEKLADKFSDR